MKLLLDKIKYDPDRKKSSMSYATLHLLRLTEKTVLDQTKHKYPFYTVYEQECSI